MSKKWIVILLITILLPGIVIVLCDPAVNGNTTTVGFVQQLMNKGYKITDVTDEYVKNQDQNYQTTLYTIEIGGTKIGEIGIMECENSDIINSQKQKAIETINSPTIDWVAAPHLYSKNKLLVEYVGNNDKLQNNIKKILGDSLAK